MTPTTSSAATIASGILNGRGRLAYFSLMLRKNAQSIGVMVSEQTSDSSTATLTVTKSKPNGYRPPSAARVGGATNVPAPTSPTINNGTPRLA